MQSDGTAATAAESAATLVSRRRALQIALTAFALVSIRSGAQAQAPAVTVDYLSTSTTFVRSPAFRSLFQGKRVNLVTNHPGLRTDSYSVGRLAAKVLARIPVAQGEGLTPPVGARDLFAAVSEAQDDAALMKEADAFNKFLNQAVEVGIVVRDGQSIVLRHNPRESAK